MSSTVGFALSPRQREIWRRRGGASVALLAARAHGPLDAARLRDAIDALVLRHEVLRTTFATRTAMKVPLQVVHADLRPAWRELAGGEDVDGLCARERAEPIDIVSGPIVRASLVSFSDAPPLLLLACPAVCVDAPSLRILLEDLAAFYAGTPPGAPPFQFADYAEWQNGLAGAEDEEARAGAAYWAGEAERAPRASTLRFERGVKGADGPFEPGSIALDTKAAAREIEALADGPGGRGAACAAGLAALLLRLGREESALLGVVSDGRGPEELARSAGLFEKTLPIRVPGGAGVSFRELQAGCARSRSDAERFRDALPWTEEPPAIRVRYSEGNAAPRDGAVSFTIERLASDAEPFELELTFSVENGALSGALRHDPALVSREAAARLAASFETLLAAAARRPETPVAELPLLGESERARILVARNDTAADVPAARSVHELFEAHAARAPERVAVVSGETRLTYGELNARANRLAHALRARGVGPDVPVGLHVSRSAEMIIGLLGILKSGGAYVPLAPEHPAGRLARQLEELRAPVVVTDRDAGALGFPGALLRLGDPALEDGDASDPQRVNGPDDLAYVIYTSGSTGLPKGVAVRHAGLLNYTAFIARLLDLAVAPAGQRFATVSTLGADLGNTAIFPALASGGSLDVIDYETSLDADAFAHRAEAGPIDVLKITPSHLEALLASPRGARILPRHALLLGGEPLPRSLARRVRELAPCALFNHYGPTETTVGSLVHRVEESDVADDASLTVPIGRPIANTRVYVLDAGLAPLPDGVPGELCIGGSGLARGYVNQAEETARRFVPDPFSGTAGARLYRTGDLVRARADGAIEFLSRVDDQVKVGGFRVEPAEVEAAARQSPAVLHAAAVPREDPVSGMTLALYVVPRGGAPLDADALGRFLRERLPEHMVPAAVLGLDALPLTPNGKLDRARLPLPKSTARPAPVAARTETETRLARIWAEVLKVPEVGVEDDFFDLGGRSLLGAQIAARVLSAFHVHVPLRTIFDAPTVARLAAHLDGLPPDAAREREMAEILAEIESLTDEEAARLLDRDAG